MHSLITSIHSSFEQASLYQFFFFFCLLQLPKIACLPHTSYEICFLSLNNYDGQS